MSRKYFVLLISIITILLVGVGTATVIIQAQDKYYNYDVPMREDGLVPIPEATEKFPAFLSKLGGTQINQLRISIGIPIPDDQDSFSAESISKMPITISGPKNETRVVVDRGMSDLYLKTLNNGQKVIEGCITGNTTTPDGIGDLVTIAVLAFPDGQADFNVAISGLFLTFGNLEHTVELRKLVVPEKYLPSKIGP